MMTFFTDFSLIFSPRSEGFWLWFRFWRLLYFQHAVKVARSLERRWHQIWLRSLEWQCLLEQWIQVINVTFIFHVNYHFHFSHPLSLFTTVSTFTFPTNSHFHFFSHPLSLFMPVSTFIFFTQIITFTFFTPIKGWPSFHLQTVVIALNNVDA